MKQIVSVSLEAKQLAWHRPGREQDEACALFDFDQALNEFVTRYVKRIKRNHASLPLAALSYIDAKE
jgi:hypothetical protein